MIDLGPCCYYLGMEVIRDRKARTITLCQKSYLKNVLERFGMANSHPVTTPMTGYLMKSPTEYVYDPELKEAYEAAVGSLMYAMTEPRPDLAHAVSEVSQFAANPGVVHFEAIKRIFRYVNGTQDLSLVFHGDSTKPLVGYVDADWGGDLSTRRPTTGYAFYVYGCLVSWSTQKQPTVSLSSCGAEYIAATQATKELLFLRRLTMEIQLTPPRTQALNILHSNNQGAIQLAHNPEFHARTKHIDIQQHFVREVVASKVMDIVWISTSKMPADGLTKLLSRVKFERFIQLIGLENATFPVLPPPAQN